MELVIAAVVAVVLAVASGAICFRFGISYRKKIAEAEITSAEAEAKRIVDEAIKVAENKMLLIPFAIHSCNFFAGFTQNSFKIKFPFSSSWEYMT